MSKLLTLILPSYNMEPYLARCLDSLHLGKPGRECLDVIVVNDGSKDRTSEIAHGYQTRFPDSIQVIDKPNGHYGSCVNAALEVARGAYVRMLDSDDWFGAAEFDEFLGWMQSEEQGGADLLLTDYELVDENGATISYCRQPFDAGVVEAATFFSAASNSYYPALPGLTYKRSLFTDIAYRQTEGVPYTDAEWIVYPMAGVRKVACKHLCVYKYFRGRNEQTMSAESMERRWRSIDTKVMKKLVDETERFIKMGSPEFQNYFRHSIKEIVTPIYEYGFLRKRELRFDGGAKGFDDYMRQVSPAATQVMESLLLPFIWNGQYLLRCPYVRWMHEGCKLKIGLFMAMWRVYAELVKMKGRLCKRRF